MYKSFLYSLSLCCLMILFQNCQKIIEPKDLPQQDPMLVVNSVISNDSIVKATISSSKSILSGKTYKMLDNAFCDLYENGAFVETMSNMKNGLYESKFIAKANKKYTLKVSCSGYKSVEGSSGVPSPFNLTKAEKYDTVNTYFYTEINGGNYAHMGGATKFKITIKDELNVKNYYNLYPVMYLLDAGDNIISTSVLPYLDLNSSNANSDISQFYGYNLDIDDKNFSDGTDIILDIKIGFDYYNNVLPPVEKIVIDLIGSQVSEDLNKYKVTLSQQASSGSTNIFTEPTLVYNNITNGIGIVGALNSTVFRIYEGAVIHK